MKNQKGKRKEGETGKEGVSRWKGGSCESESRVRCGCIGADI